MKVISTAMALTAFSFLCPGQTTIVGSITHDELQREYILYIPASYTPGTPAPLVFNFHGYTSGALEQMFYGDFRPIADTAGFLVVHPQGTIDLLGNPHWNVGWGSSTVDDVGFTSALIDSLSAQYSIDQERVYSTGMSNGGFFSYKLACELSDRIAAIASVTGSMNTNQSATCDAQHPMPVMEIHGTADPTVPYNGTAFFSSTPSVVGYWAQFNETDMPATVVQIDDSDPNDGSTVEHQLFENGNNGAEVEHYKVNNGGHTWPGTAFTSAGTNHDIDASQEIWRFFSKYDIHGLINPTSIDDHSGLSEGVNIHPNPATRSISIETKNSRNAHFSLTTVMGQMVARGILEKDIYHLSLNGLPSGVYLLTVGSRCYRIVKQ